MNIINLTVPAGVSSPVAECGAVMIGYVGEGGVTQVVVDFTAWAEAYGDGVITLGVQRSGDPTWYPVALTVDGTTAAWLVSKLDTNTEGMGAARFAYTVGGAEKRSAVWHFFVDRGLQSPEGDAPDPYESWVETLTELGAETLQNAKDAQEAADAAEQSATDAAGSAESAETAKNAAGAAAAAAGDSARVAGENASTAQGAAQTAQSAAGAAEHSALDAEAAQQAAETAVTHYPKIVNDYWWVWDAERGEYVNTGVKAKGEGGEGAVLSVNGQTGAVTLDAEDVGALPKTGDGSNVTAAFTAAANRTNISTGEKLSVIFGKIAKWFSDLGSAAFRAATGSITQGSTDLVESGAVYNGLSGKYTKPAGGIPASDMAQAVQTSLDKADTALQEHQSLAAYRTAAAQDVIDTAQNTAIAGKVADVQINGTSIVDAAHVATVPVISDYNQVGAVRIGGIDNGLAVVNGTTVVAEATDSLIKSGSENTRRTISPGNQHKAVFYGLAKAAGSDEKNSTLPVGQYTESAKSAISTMLNGSVTVTGTTPTITALPGVRYVCGEVTTLDITLPASGVVDVTFESGSTATVLTITPPSGVTLKWANGFDPTSLEANKAYEINIMDGLGVAASWT